MNGHTHHHAMSALGLRMDDGVMWGCGASYWGLLCKSHKCDQCGAEVGHWVLNTTKYSGIRHNHLDRVLRGWRSPILPFGLLYPSTSIVSLHAQGHLYSQNPYDF